MLTITNFHNWFAPLPEPIQQEIFSCMSLRNLQSGEALFMVGEPATEMFQVVSGKIKCNMYSHDGQEVIVSNMLPGDSFGEMGLIDNLPRITNAFAAEASQIRVLSKKHYLRLSQKHPEINTQLMVMFCHRMRLSFTTNADNLTLNLRQRLARFLSRMIYSQETKNGPNKDILIDVSQEMLGRALGASRQSISKELKAIEQTGALAINYGKITIIDADKLAAEYDYLLGNEQIAPDYRKDNS